MATILRSREGRAGWNLGHLGLSETKPELVGFREWAHELPDFLFEDPLLPVSFP